ncbi:MAG: hypothetical protein U1E70_04085 [Acetobacteraceae bacterium]|nr:hypothetical protein [Pseudomonadota bacterium]
MSADRLTSAVLLVAFHHRLTAPDADTGISLLAEAAGRSASPEAWRNAVAGAVFDGLLHDPVRLPEGALQCHWHLELTPKGVAAVRGLRKD